MDQLVPGVGGAQGCPKSGQHGSCKDAGGAKSTALGQVGPELNFESASTNPCKSFSELFVGQVEVDKASSKEAALDQGSWGPGIVVVCHVLKSAHLEQLPVRQHHTNPLILLS